MRRALLLLACAVAAEAAAQFPSRPLHLIVPYPPGGFTDIVARLVAPKLGESLGQPVVVENRSGSGGNIGAEAAAKAAPDGHTLMMASPPFAISQSLYKSLPYDPAALAPVAMLADFPNLLVVGAGGPDRSVAELIERARRNPGKLNYASSGSATSNHLTAELLKLHTGTRITHVPYRGAPAAQLSVIALETDFYFNNIAPALPLVQAGRLRALAVTSARRSPLLPEVPTVAEAGLPALEISTFVGVMTSRAAPREAVARLEAELQRIMALAEIASAIERLGGVAQYAGSRQFGAFVAQESRKWAEAVRHSGAVAD